MRPWRLWIVIGVVTLLACRLPGRLVGIGRPATATALPTATITPVRVVTDTRRFTQAPKTTEPEEPGSPTPTPSPAETATGQVTEAPKATSQPSETPGQGAAPSPEATLPGAEPTQEGAYPPPQAQSQATAYPGAATDFPIYNPYPDGETPPPPATQTPSPALESPADTPTLPVEEEAAPGSPTPTWTPVRVSPTPSAPSQPATPTPARTPTPFVLPSPTLTRTPTPTRTPLPAPPWFNARITASDPRKVVLAAGKPQLVEFFAFWSGPSLALAPVVQGVESEYTGRVIFTYLDIDNPATEPFKRELRFRYEPHFFLLDGQGNVLRQWLGYVPAEELRLAIEDALS